MSVSTSPSGMAAVVDEFIVCSTYSDRTSMSSKDFSKFSMTYGRGGVRAEKGTVREWAQPRAGGGERRENTERARLTRARHTLPIASTL